MTPLTCMGENINMCRIFSGKSKGKNQLGGHRRRCEDNIKSDFKQIAE